MSAEEPQPEKKSDWEHVKWYKPAEEEKPETKLDEAESYGAILLLFGLAFGGAALVSPYILAFIFGGGGSRHHYQNHGYAWMEWFAEHDGKEFALLRLVVGAGFGIVLAIAGLWVARNRKDQ